MITLLLKATLAETFGAVVELHTDVDGWATNPVQGVYDPAAAAWRYGLDYARYAGGFRFKFFVRPSSWQAGGDLVLKAADLADGGTHTYQASDLDFPAPRPEAPVVELGWAQRRLFNEEVDPARLFDVIVIGSGMAGGTLADDLSDGPLEVLLLEAGGFLFPTHIGNLPRQQKPGVFTKHIWELWDEFGVKNYENEPGSDYVGAQGFNLGGRSVFWGGFIPRMTSWELDYWPATVQWYLEDIGYLLAEEFMGRSTGPRTLYNREIHLLLRDLFPGMNHADAPVAVRQQAEGANTVATGVFSTADVITESWLTDSPTGKQGLHVLLNHLAVKVVPDASEVRVTARDLRADREVTYRAKCVVLSAGCLESARLAKRSGLPGGALVGQGVSDHPIFFTHFSIPRQSRYFDLYGNVKILSQPKEGKDPTQRAPFNMLLELGADLNQGRYLDESIWREHLDGRKDRMLCELVFLCNEALDPKNGVSFDGAEFRPRVKIKKYDRPTLLDHADELKYTLLKRLGAQPADGTFVDPEADPDGWERALAGGEGMPGGVAHEVGSLRMEVKDRDGKVVSPGVVDGECRYLGVASENVYVCDLSVFPTTPAANPSLTVVALALRLGEHLRQKLKNS